MERRDGRREALRGAEVQLVDLLFEEFTSEQLAELLKGPLELTAGEGNRGLAKKLLEAGAQTGCALHVAIRGGHREMVNDLLEREPISINARDDDYDSTALHVAVEEGQSEIVELLVMKGADIDAVDSSGCTPLYYAALHGPEAAALAIMAGGADVNLRCGDLKASAVHLAAGEGYVDTLRAAIEHGADLDAVDDNPYRRRTPLHHAAYFNSFKSIDVLVEAGANIEARTEDGAGWTPMHCASFGHRIEALTALLKHGAHVNAPDHYLQTPLHVAVQYANSPKAIQLVDLLLRSGADETIVDENGKAAVDVLAEGVRELFRLDENIEGVRQLLTNAPADRAWRRRGYLVLCRAHPDRVHQARETHITRACTGWSTHDVAKLPRAEGSRCRESDGGNSVDEGIGADCARVVARVLGLQEEVYSGRLWGTCDAGMHDWKEGVLRCNYMRQDEQREADVP